MKESTLASATRNWLSILRLGMCCVALASIMSCGDDDQTVTPTPPPPHHTSYYVADEKPSWSADGKWIAYYHLGITNLIDGDNYTVDLDSAGVCVVDTAGVGSHLVLNALIAEGKFARSDNSILIQANLQLYSSRFTDGVLEPLTPLTTGGSNFDPTWSFDDAFIAYESNASGQYAIWKMKSNGADKTPLPLAWRTRVTDVDWFPSGDRIVGRAYNTEIHGFELLVFDTTGTVIKHLAPCDDEAHPHVSPDGKTIAYVRREGQWLWVWTVGDDGSNAHPLVKGMDPTWSPDGEWLAYIASDWSADKKVNMLTIWKLHIPTGVSKRLTKGPPNLE